MSEASQPLNQQMLQPQFYPHLVTEPIQLIQTHVSYVLLTVIMFINSKKPVNRLFDFQRWTSDSIFVLKSCG